MPNVQNLMPGRAGRQLHAEKVRQVLEFCFKVHIITSRVVMRLLGTSQSNSATLLRKLEEQELLRQVNIKYSVSAPRGNAYLLTPRGAAIAVRDLSGPLHQYDHRPESVRLDQSEHDLQLAELAAAWVCRGATLTHTDFMLRQVVKDHRNKKIPDLLLQYGGAPVAIEFERQAKAGRELDQMISAAVRAGNTPTIWFFSVQSTFEHFQAALERKSVCSWKLNASNKWTVAGEFWLPISWRSEQLAVRVEPESAAGDNPFLWVDRLCDVAGMAEWQCTASLKDQGWTWGYLRASDVGMYFPLSIQNDEHDMKLALTYLEATRHWYVHAADEIAESGYDLGEARVAPKVVGVEPDLGRLERAIRKVIAMDYDV